MSFGSPDPAPAPTVDPALAQQQADARQQRIQSLQQSLSSDTFGILKMFGANSAQATAGIAAPFSTTSGGFATPFMSTTGQPKVTQAVPGAISSDMSPWINGGLAQMGYK
jgi:hypothetical protein